MATVAGSQRQLTHTSNTYESNGDVTIGGNLNINGTTTTIDTANLLVEDKNIVIGDVSSPSDTTADGGGITLKGASDKTINWINSTSSWTSNQTFSAPNLTLTNLSTYSGSDITALMISGGNIVGKRELGTNAFNSTAFLTSYTETDTLATVTARGNVTSQSISISNTLSTTNTIFARKDNVSNYANAQVRLDSFGGSSSLVGLGFHISGSVGKMLFTNSSGDLFWDSTNSKIWHAGNDGSGSGLDADTLDGYNAEEGAVNNSIVKRDGTASIKAYGLSLLRQSTARTGITWYNEAYYNWQDYMASAGTTGCGPNGNLTAPTGLAGVTSWALRSRMEGVATYGWNWETGGSAGGGATATSKMSLNATTGNLEIAGTFKSNSINAATSDTDKFLVSDGGTIEYRTGAQVLSDIGAAASSHTHTKLEGFSNQTEYDLIRAGNINGLYMKARWDSATTNRYWDMGYVDGNGTFYTGLKVINGGDITYKGNEMWHAGNDGSGSGLDADLLDGIQGTSFLRSDANDTATGTYTFSNTVYFGTNPSNAGRIEIADNSTTDYKLRILGTGTRAFELQGSGSTANFLTSFTNASTGAHNISVSGSGTFSANLTVNGGGIVLGGTGRIQGIDTVSAGTDAVNKSYADTKAPLASPALTGTPTAPTAAANTNTTQIATTAYVQTEISDLIGVAPAALDTLNELAAAINDDASYASSITTALAAKAPLSSPTFTGTVTTPNLSIGSGNKIKFANNDFIRYDDGNGVGRFHFDADGGTNNASVQAATFVGALSGNASTATTLATARTIALSGDVTGSVSFNGSSNVSISTLTNKLRATDDRDVKPNTTGIGASGVKAIKAFFTTFDGMTGSSGGAYQDMIALDTYSDSSGGGPSAMTFSKSASVGSPQMYIWKGAYGGTTWGTGQRVFADNYHPNADTLTTARTIAGTSFNGSANIDINYNNLTNKPTIPSAANDATITLQGGGGITTTIGNFTTNQSSAETLTISHSDTSSQASVNNSDGTVIQDIFLDTYGHITGLGSANLDTRYYTQTKVTNHFKTLAFQGNYMSTYQWSTDSSGSVDSGWGGLGDSPYYPNGTYGQNGSDSENIRSISLLPNGSYGVVWRTPLSDTNSDGDGGWNCIINGVQDSKLYRSVVYFRRTADVDDGQFYHGCNGSHTLNVSDATANSNPYFHNTSIDDKFIVDRWYVSVGYIQPYQSGGSTNSARSGIYDCVTGKKILSGSDFMMKSGSTQQQHRTYIYYTTNPSTEGEFWGPRFEEVNGNEPSIRELIAKGADGVNGMTIHSEFDPATLDQLTETSDANDDKFLIWDKSAGIWKYMRLDDLQDAIDTNTTYTLSSFGITATSSELNFTDGVTSNIQTQLNGKQASGTYNTIIGTDSDINTSGSTIIDNIYVTDGVITSMGTRTLTLADLGYTGATNANNYSLPLAASGTRGGVQIGYAENGKNYPVELSSEKMFVNVPWTDNNTTYSAGTGISLSGTTFSLTDTNAKLNLSGGTLTGDLVVEDSEIHVGDKSNDQWTRILHTSANGYGFSWQHTNATILVNEQGSTNQVMVLGDVDASNSYSGLFGIAHSTNGGTSWTKKLDLRGGGDLYIGSSGTSKVFHDGYHPNADTLTTARTISLGGDLSGSASFNGSSNITITAAVADDSHNHVISNVDGLQTALNGKLNTAGGTMTGNLEINTDRAVYNASYFATSTASTRHKFRLYYTDTNYAIGMQSNVTYGGLNNDWAMTFQFNSDNDRGFWWGDSSHTTAQGAMALTTQGKLSVARTVRVGYGETDTTIPSDSYADYNIPIKHRVYTASTLPSASPAGQRAFISDSAYGLATAIGSVVSGGGGNTIPVYSDGSSWRAG